MLPLLVNYPVRIISVALGKGYFKKASASVAGAFVSVVIGAAAGVSFIL